MSLQILKKEYFCKVEGFEMTLYTCMFISYTSRNLVEWFLIENFAREIFVLQFSMIFLQIVLSILRVVTGNTHMALESNRYL